MDKAHCCIQMAVFLRGHGVAENRSADMATYTVPKAGSMREASCDPCEMVQGSAHGLILVCATRGSGEFEFLLGTCHNAACATFSQTTISNPATHHITNAGKTTDEVGVAKVYLSTTATSLCTMDCGMMICGVVR
jgi:hypothetical protein